MKKRTCYHENPKMVADHARKVLVCEVCFYPKDWKADQHGYAAQVKAAKGKR